MTLTLKNIPDDLYERLKESADLHRRSLNSEILACLERALAGGRIDGDEVIARARAIRQRIGGTRLTAGELAAARESGRR